MITSQAAIGSRSLLDSMSTCALVVETRAFVEPGLNVLKDAGRTNELRELIKFADRMTPPVALAQRSEIVGRLEPEREVELPDVFVLTATAQLACDVELELRTITPVVRTPLKQEHIAGGLHVAVLRTDIAIERRHRLNCGSRSQRGDLCASRIQEADELVLCVV